MSSFLRPKNVIHIKYIIAIFVIEPIILDTFAWFREHSARIPRGFVLEAGVAYPIGRGKMACKSLKGLSWNYLAQI